eukprot:gene13023-biopygen8437
MFAANLILVALHSHSAAGANHAGPARTEWPHPPDGDLTAAVVYSPDGSSAVRLLLDLGMPPDGLPRIDPTPG